MDENDQFFLTGLEKEVFDVAEKDIYRQTFRILLLDANVPILLAGPSGRNRIPF